MSVKKYRLKNDSPHQVFGSEKDGAGDYVEKLKNTLKIEVQSMTDEEMVFDLIGVDVSIANALRRILLAEVATMAIENVYIWINSSILHDEVLAHRIGLVPIQADPAKFEAFAPGDEPTDANTLVFRLDVKYQRPEGAPDEPGFDREGRPCARAPTLPVAARALEWMPQGAQGERLADIGPVHGDILLAKLRPGQQITLEAHCRKGTGKDHAKYSPVATAAYRLLPKISFQREVRDAEAEGLVALCPMGVFDIEDLGEGRGKTARVARPRDCTMCRECIRQEEHEDRLKLERVADHFIFSVESVGVMPAKRIVKEAIQVLKNKCTEVLREIQLHEESTTANDEEDYAAGNEDEEEDTEMRNDS